MERLKLFPLNTVLFPGGLMPLHIFEPRYRQMVADCLASDRRFGLVFHDPEHSRPFDSEPGRVGCVAEIEQHQLLPDGRALIVTRGTQRFQIEDLVESDALYAEGLVDPYEDEKPPSPSIRAHRMKTLSLFTAILETMSEESEESPEIDLEEDLSFQLASVLHLDPAWMQTLLEIRDEEERLELLDGLFRAVLAGGLTGAEPE